jgi:hypothetical protein
VPDGPGTHADQPASASHPTDEAALHTGTDKTKN